MPLTPPLPEAVPIFMEKDDAKKSQLLAAFKAEAAPAFLQNISEVLKKNGGKFLGRVGWHGRATRHAFRKHFIGLQRYRKVGFSRNCTNCFLKNRFPPSYISGIHTLFSTITSS